jgi:hypothetical protein
MTSTSTPRPVSHALVLPNLDFNAWFQAAEAYLRTFPRVVVVRGATGNDLNRYRNVTAVQAPGVWQNNDALTHIRRVYPMVVRVDLIRAALPSDLANVLNQRVQRNDRYGEQLTPGNIFDRFTIDWPSDARPGQILRPFNTFHPALNRNNEGLDIAAPVGTIIRAANAGTVATVMRQQTSLGYQQYVQISSRIRNLQYMVTYAFLRNIRVNVGQVVKVGDIIAESGLHLIRVVVQQPGAGLSGFVLPNIVDPTPLIYWQDMRLRINVSGLRIREKPGTEFKVIGQITPFDRVETLEPHGRTLLKLGKENEWLKIRTPQTEGFSAAQYLIADETTGVQALNLTGMNLDLLHRLGKPAPERLRGLGWVRFPYSVSMERGSTDLNAAYNFYAPFIDRYAKAGLKVILVLTHQTYGEGAGFVWPQMDTGRWRQLTARYADFASQIARRFAGRNQIAAYQIWNEQDTPPNIAQAAVPMPPADYGFLLSESIKAIRAADPLVRIITGGHISGPGNGANYCRQALSVMPAGTRPDGIACHSYGRGDPANRYSGFGPIDEDIESYGSILPGAPVWITEFGVLDRWNDPAVDIADYATSFVSRVKRLYAARTAAAVWYAWADTMHNGYGLVDRNDQPKQPLMDRFLRA